MKLSRFQLLLLIIFCLLIHATELRAEELPHKIIAFFDPAEGSGDYYFTNMHQRAEMPLNRLGLEVIPWSIKDPLPNSKDLVGSVGFVSWFNRPSAFKNPDVFCDFLSAQMKSGYRWLSLGYIGIYDPKTQLLSPKCQQTLKILGIEDGGQPSNNPYYMEVVSKDASMVEFERKFELSEGIEYQEFKSIHPKSRVYLTLKRTDLKDSQADMVVSTPMGGFVAPKTAIYLVQALDKCHWRINPFLFFEEALGLKGNPRPDITTINGARLFYSHIDGDGIVNASQIYEDTYSGEVIYKDILKNESALPVSVSLITGYFDQPEYNTERVIELYRHMYELPSVEASSHGYAHPLVWKKGIVALKIPGYEYNPQKEIEGSAARLDQLLSSLGIQKKISLFQWTGDCLPGEDATKSLVSSGLLNINGGGTRFDKLHDGYGWVTPIGILRWGMRQIYTGAPNENVYTNLWQGPYYGFKEVIETFIRTESPMRVKPINLYYHFYSGERLAALNALKQVYEFIKKQDILPIFTSEYAQMAQDFFNVRLTRVGEGAYRVTQNGLVKTLRFDQETRNVDMKISKGVLGYTHINGSLYVHFDESTTQDVRLTREKPNSPLIDFASFKIKEATLDSRKTSFLKQGWYREKLILKGMKPNSHYKVSEADAQYKMTSDATGILNVEFKSMENGREPTPVTIELETL